MGLRRPAGTSVDPWVDTTTAITAAGEGHHDPHPGLDSPSSSAGTT